MRDYLGLGPAPSDEPCAQVGTTDYTRDARKEGLAYIQAVRRKVGEEPEGAHLALKSFPHDFGTYYDVVVYYDTQIPEAVAYAFRADEQAPTTWKEVGMEPPVPHGRADRGR